MEIPIAEELSRKWRMDEVLEILGIKDTTYYKRLTHLNIKPSKDEEGTYITAEQMQVMEDLNQHIRETGRMRGFRGGGGQLAVAENSGLELALEIPEEVEADFDINDEVELSGLIREAAVLKVQQEAMPELVKLHLAAQMTVEDLPEDLRAKLQAVKEAANPNSPKQNPATIAQQMLQRHRSGKGQA